MFIDPAEKAEPTSVCAVERYTFCPLRVVELENGNCNLKPSRPLSRAPTRAEPLPRWETHEAVSITIKCPEISRNERETPSYTATWQNFTTFYGAGMVCNSSNRVREEIFTAIKKMKRNGNDNGSCLELAAAELNRIQSRKEEIVMAWHHVAK